MSFLRKTISAKEAAKRLASDVVRDSKDQSILRVLNQIEGVKVDINDFSDDEFRKFEIECIFLLMFLVTHSCHAVIDDEHLRNNILDEFHLEMYSYLEEVGFSSEAISKFESMLAARYKRYFELSQRVGSGTIGGEVMASEMLRNLLPSKFHKDAFLGVVLFGATADHMKNLKALSSRQKVCK